MPKIQKKSPIHENVDANITCDFGDGAVSRSRSRLPTYIFYNPFDSVIKEAELIVHTVSLINCFRRAIHKKLQNVS